MRDSGNMWSGWVAHLSFFRHVAQLDIDYSKFAHYEAATTHGSVRYAHARFWVVSDRPLEIHRDARNRPHRVGGPNLRWSDGTAIYSLAGIRVTRAIAMGEFGVHEIDEQRNAEIRRLMIDQYNRGDSGRYLRDSGARVTHQDLDEHGRPRKILRREVADDEPIVAVALVNSTPEPDGTHKRYTFRVPPSVQTVPEAMAWHFDVPSYPVLDVQS